MAVLRLNAHGDVPLCARHSEQPLEALLTHSLHNLPEKAPVVFLTHGLRYSPWQQGVDPHDRILSAHPQRHHWKAKAWPRKLGLAPDQNGQGLAIALGWHARSSLWQAIGKAEQAGRALGRVADLVTDLRPDLRLGFVGHSLAGRVAMEALFAARHANFRRILLLSPAEHLERAARALAAPAARNVDVVSVLTAEDKIFSLGFAAATGARAILAHGGPQSSNWVDLRISEPHVVDALAQRGLPLAPWQRSICHWSAYLRAGVWPIYRQFLMTPEKLPLSALREIATKPKDTCTLGEIAQA